MATKPKPKGKAAPAAKPAKTQAKAPEAEKRENRYLNEHNRDPKPFVWTKPARDILAKLTRLPVPSV